jgi:hypothetical protein
MSFTIPHYLQSRAREILARMALPLCEPVERLWRANAPEPDLRNAVSHCAAGLQQAGMAPEEMLIVMKHLLAASVPGLWSPTREARMRQALLTLAIETYYRTQAESVPKPQSA